MAKAENEEAVRPRPRFTTLLPSEHLRRTAAKAGHELDMEQADSVVSIARLLGEIDDVESRTDLQTRLVMIEDQVERLHARRDEVDQAIESELNVLRTTVESALEAIASLALPAPEPEVAPENLEMLRNDFDAKIMEARSDLRFEIVNLHREHMATPLGSEELEAIREDFQSRIDASDERAAKSSAYLGELVAGLREELSRQSEQLEHQKSRQAEVIHSLSKQLAGFASALSESGTGEEPGQQP